MKVEVCSTSNVVVIILFYIVFCNSKIFPIIQSCGSPATIQRPPTSQPSFFVTASTVYTHLSIYKIK